MIRKFLFVTIWFFFVINSAECETPISREENIYFYPVADTYVNEHNTNISDSDLELRVGNQNSINIGNLRSVLKFDISAIPENSVLNEARLYVYSFDTKQSWNTTSIQAYAAPDSWSESSIDWSRLNDQNAQIVDSLFVAGIPGSSPGAYSWDITEIVRSWIQGKNNFGIVLQCDSVNINDYIIIYSSENLIFKPYLEISYTPSDSAPPEFQLSGKNTDTADRMYINEPDETVNFDTADKTKIHFNISSVKADALIPAKVTFSRQVQSPAKVVVPEITRHPQSQLINPGAPATFSVKASGMPPFKYQWLKDGENIDGAISDAFTIDSVSEINEGYYVCKISNNAGSVISDDAELMMNISPVQKSTVNAPAPSEPSAEKSIKPKKQPEPVVGMVESVNKPRTPRPEIAETSGFKDATDSGSIKKSLYTIKDLSLKSPPGQGVYVHNGNTLTFSGTAFPHAKLISACLEDDQDRVIRNISNVLKIDPETGKINGSVFVGSFRGAETVHLNVRIQMSSGGQSVTGTSNTLFIDQGYPEIGITEPAGDANFQTAPIVIYGTASDDLSGIASVEISTDGGATFCKVDIFRNNQWLYSLKPKAHAADYNVKVRATDNVGLSTMSDILTIYYNPSSPSFAKTTISQNNKLPGHSRNNISKSPDDNGICTYRILNLESNRFQPADMFTIKEQMAIIVKGYGGKMVTVKIIDPSLEKVVFELSDYIPANKNKMWKWKLSQTGSFQAALFVDGSFQDDIFFKIIQ